MTFSYLFLSMDEYPVLFTKIVLIKDRINPANLNGKKVFLEIDQAYTIGKSIVVIYDEVVVGHLPRESTKTVWCHLRTGTKLSIDVYKGTIENGWKNEPWFSMQTRSFEIGIRVQFQISSREDSKLFVAYVT